MHQTDESPGGEGQGSREVRDNPQGTSFEGSLSPDHQKFLNGQAVKSEVLDRLECAFSVMTQADAEKLGGDFPFTNWIHRPYIAFKWVSPSGRVEWQVRPDTPVPDQNKPGKFKKYIYRSKNRGYQPVLWEVKRVDSPRVVLIVEGTKQCLSAAGYAADDVAVYGIGGCRQWMSEGLPIPDLVVAEGREVVVLLDADAATNPDVYDAGTRLGGALMDEGATRVSFAQITGAGEKDGLDDVLGGREEDKRASFLARIIDRAQDKPAKIRPRSRAKKKPDQELPIAGDGRAVVVTTGDRLGVITDLTKAMTSMFSGTRLFNHGGVISQHQGDAMTPLDRGSFNSTSAQAALMVAESGEDYVPGWADENTMKAVLADASGFAPLEQIRRCPFVRKDGSICQTAGYDEASRSILTEEGALDGLEVPESPSAEEVSAARDLLLGEWLGDMPFPDQASRANALAMLLTPFVRGHFVQVPMGVIDGLQMGVGKNKLADCISIVVTGEATHPINFVEDENEQRKQITAAFRTGAEMFVFDEAHSIGGKALAQALTAATWQDRILGVSSMANFPNAITWMALGNQVVVRGDINRRTYRVALWPTYANPQNRAADTFRHPGVSGLELEDWTRENRSALVRAVLVLVRAWFAAGEPAPSRRLTFGSFNTWERVVGGVIENAGVPGFLENLDSWREVANEESQFVISHLTWLYEQFGEGVEFRTAEVKTKALTDPMDYQALLGLEDPSQKNFTVELGKAYGRMKDRLQGGYKLRKRGGQAKTVVWSVVREVSEVSEVCPPPFMSGCVTDVVRGEETSYTHLGNSAGGHPSDTSDTSEKPEVPANRSYCDWGNWDHTSPDQACDFCDNI